MSNSKYIYLKTIKNNPFSTREVQKKDKVNQEIILFILKYIYFIEVQLTYNVSSAQQGDSVV